MKLCNTNIKLLLVLKLQASNFYSKLLEKLFSLKIISLIRNQSKDLSFHISLAESELFAKLANFQANFLNLI
jgi:hypothetical protein